MSSPPAPVVNLQTAISNLISYWYIWLMPAFLCTAGAAWYATQKQDVWQASQAVWVRDEAAASSDQGAFVDSDSMRAALETVLEIARNHKVVSAALEQVGPPARRNTRAAWPTSAEVAAVRDAIQVVAPQGAEFGGTEFVYLTVQNTDRQRALALTEAVSRQMEIRLQELRRAKADSLFNELGNAFTVAFNDLEQSTTRLEAMEREAGSDLGELRILNDTGAGHSNLRSSLENLVVELREAKRSHRNQQQQREQLQASLDDPGQLVATPSRVLDAHPALKRLKDGLIDAQLRTAELQGSMRDAHPSVLAAVAAEREVRGDLKSEVEAALRGLEGELATSARLITSLEQQVAASQSRLDRLAGMRARYANLVSEVRQRSQIVEEAQRDMSAARARQAAANSSSLLTRLDQPRVGDFPLGPGRTTIVAAGAMGGLMAGLGLLILIAPWNRSRRWSDYLGVGRRASDQSGTGRRVNDAAERTAAANRPDRRQMPTDPREPAAALTAAPVATPDATMPSSTVPSAFPVAVAVAPLPRRTNTGPLNLVQSLRRIQANA